MRVLILTGAGRAFCAGLDLKELGTASRAGLGETRRDPRGDPVAALTRFNGPVIGAINGAAVTGGFELALACDVLLASPAARFADTHARVGLASGWGLSQKLSRAVGIYRAREISFSGRWVSAEQAQTGASSTAWCRPNDLLTAARALAADMLLRCPACSSATSRSSTTASRCRSAKAWRSRTRAARVQRRCRRRASSTARSGARTQPLVAGGCGAQAAPRSSAA